MLLNITACSGEPSSGGEESGVSGNMSDEERIIAAAEAGKVGNWGLGNEYEIQALLNKVRSVYRLCQHGFHNGSV